MRRTMAAKGFEDRSGVHKTWEYWAGTRSGKWEGAAGEIREKPGACGVLHTGRKTIKKREWRWPLVCWVVKANEAWEQTVGFSPVEVTGGLDKGSGQMGSRKPGWSETGPQWTKLSNFIVKIEEMSRSLEVEVESRETLFTYLFACLFVRFLFF